LLYRIKLLLLIFDLKMEDLPDCFPPVSVEILIKNQKSKQLDSGMEFKLVVLCYVLWAQ